MSNCNAVCKFCGQYFKCDEGEDPNEYALEHCNCPDASNYRKKQNFIAKAKNALHEIFSEQLTISESDSNDEDITEVRAKLEAFLPFLVDFKIYSITLSIADFGKVNISVNADGNIKMKRSAGSSIERKI